MAGGSVNINSAREGQDSYVRHLIAIPFIQRYMFDVMDRPRPFAEAIVTAERLARLLYRMDTDRNGRPTQEQVLNASRILKKMLSDDSEYVPYGWTLHSVDKRSKGRTVAVFRIGYANPEDPTREIADNIRRWLS